MSTIKPLALYQIETFGTGFRHQRAGEERQQAREDQTSAREEPAMRQLQKPSRASEFLVQLMVGGDSDLRKVIGRRDVAGRRETAYGETLANRPSARPLSFLRIVATA